MIVSYDDVFHTIIGTSVIFMNSLLLIGIIYHRREFLIIFLWYYAVLFFIVTIVGLSGFPVLVMTLSGISMLIVYALLKFFENDIPDPRFEVFILYFDVL